MTLQEIIERAQKAADDYVGLDTDHLWKVDEWADFANEAVNVFCEELLLITDSSTASICTINVVAGTRSYAYDSRIVQFDEVRYSSRTRPLKASNVGEFLYTDSQWRTRKGLPEMFALDDTSGYLTLNKEPEANATITMTVKRLPLVDLTESNLEAIPEIRPLYHKKLLNYMLFKAFSKPDTETLDTEKADKHYRLYLKDKSDIQDAENTLHKGTKTRYRGYFG